MTGSLFIRPVVQALIVALIAFSASVAPQIAKADEQTQAAVQPPQATPRGDTDPTYTLGSRDKVRIIVFGETDLGGEFVVDDAGFLRMPLIGQIAAGGRSVRQVEDEIAAKLSAQYLKNPRVSVEVLTYRPFYILGEVNKPGEYPFAANMSVLNAVALAGGYTYRANETNVYIRRKGAKEEVKYPADETTKLMPGDVVNVAERWF